MSTSVLTGNIVSVGVASVTLSPAIVNAATSNEQTFTVPGLRVGDMVCVSKPTTQAGLGIAGARVSAANTLAITFINATAGGLTPTASEVYLVFWARPDAVVTGAVS
jgi:hypothetical protein